MVIILFVQCQWRIHGHRARYIKLLVARAPGMPGTFFPSLRVSDRDMHHDTCVTHVPWCMPRSLTSGFLLSRWRGKRSRHSRRMRNPQFYVSGKRPMKSIGKIGRYQTTKKHNNMRRVCQIIEIYCISMYTCLKWFCYISVISVPCTYSMRQEAE